MLSKTAAILACLEAGTAHFGMNKPSPWQDHNGTHGMGRTWRMAGCKLLPAPGEKEFAQGCATEWYTNNTIIPGESTLPQEMRTYQDYSIPIPFPPFKITFPSHKNPWHAPGSAPVASPCGIDGGNADGCPAGNRRGGGCAPGGYGHGPDGRTLKGNLHPAEWKAGEVVETSWGVTANHGGGYQFRLCPYDKSKPKMEALTEDCFQKTPLKFVGDTQWVQWNEDESSRVAIKARRTTVGTTPAGSEWTRNPIPACAGPGGGTAGGSSVLKPWNGHCKPWIDGQLYQFPPPAKGVFGFWGWQLTQPRGQQFSIVDKVQIPADLPEGDYVLSFRIDCEQTAQVWNSCADIHISAAARKNISAADPDLLV